MTPDRQSRKDISPWEAMGLVWDLLITVIVLTLIFAFGGVYLDRLANTKFIFTVLGFIALVFFGKKILMKKAKAIVDRLNAKTEDSEKT